jgi:hypothetical protein
MTEAFEIGVSLALQDGVSEAIGKARRDVAALEQIVLGSGISLRSLREVATRAASVPIADPAGKVAEQPARQKVPEAMAGLEAGGALVRPARPAGGVDEVVAGPVGAAPQRAPRAAALEGQPPAMDVADTAKDFAVQQETAVFSASAPRIAELDGRFALPRQSVADESGAAPVVAAPVVGRQATQGSARAIETAGEGSEMDLVDAAVCRSAVAPLGSTGDGRAEGSGLRSVMLESVLRLPPIAPWTQAGADGQALGGDPGGADGDADAALTQGFAGSGIGLCGAQEIGPAGAGGQMRPAAPPAQKREQAPHGGDVFLDGAKVGRWMSRFLNREAERASAGPTSFDPRRGRLLPGVTVGG